MPKALIITAFLAALALAVSAPLGLASGGERTATATTADDHGRGVEPGDDRGAAVEPGDDKGAAVEPGDDRGAAVEPGDDRGTDFLTPSRTSTSKAVAKSAKKAKVERHSHRRGSRHGVNRLHR